MLARFSIRNKLMMVALLLLLIPWMSYVYVRQMKTFLLSGQEQALTLTSRAIATVLHDRPELFSEANLANEVEQEGNELYAIPLPDYIQLNGDASDWGAQADQSLVYNSVNATTDQTSENNFSVRKVLGYHGRFIYVLFQVNDDSVVFRQSRFLRVDAADHIRLTLQDPGENPRRYTLIAAEPGRMSIYLMDAQWQYPITGEPNYNLAAEIGETDSGYLVELRIPRYLISSDTRLRMEVVDVDDVDSLEIRDSISTTPLSESDGLPRLLVQSAEIAKIIRALDRSDTRIWVFNQSGDIQIVVGDISIKNNKNHIVKPVLSSEMLDYIQDYITYIYDLALNYIFARIGEIPNHSDTFADISEEERNNQIIDVALNGQTMTDRRPAIDNQATILMSSHPVFLGEQILGAVVVEQSSDEILQQQKSVLENVISVTLLVFLIVVMAILLFASRLTMRIRRLRNAADNAIDRHGRIIYSKLSTDTRSRDEIGDLSRSVSNMLGRLSQYTQYLRGLPDTLAHEVSNPLNVVNSSLHNLSQENPAINHSKYLERATNGINRIGSILQNLTEAANLEQAMENESREIFDLAELIESYVDGYSFSNPDQKFDIVVNHRPIKVEAAADYIAQALDKLVDNAIDFAATDTAIVFDIQRLGQNAQINIINQGSRLPDGMSERIFEPLVSLGRKHAQKTKLGMGLYIVKLIANFHAGDVVANNLDGGVMFSLTLPLYTPNQPNQHGQ